MHEEAILDVVARRAHLVRLGARLVAAELAQAHQAADARVARDAQDGDKRAVRVGAALQLP